jgi:hypothetical protein
MGTTLVSLLKLEILSLKTTQKWKKLPFRRLGEGRFSRTTEGLNEVNAFLFKTVFNSKLGIRPFVNLRLLLKIKVCVLSKASFFSA